MRMNKKRLWLGISGAFSLLLFVILLFISNALGTSQDSQRMAERWSEKKDVAQISCFFSPNAGVTSDSIIEFEHSTEQALVEAAITSESENPSARLWADAYSADGQITLSSDRSSVETDALGVGGDFFLFHPVELVTGAYFSGNDLMKDYCVIDEDTAWQLFGSNDIAGQLVTIGGTPHIVTGVFKRESGRLFEAAGLDSALVFVSYETLHKFGRDNGINHYEIVMPNPVKNFALQHVKEKIGVQEKEMEILENNSRYSLISKLKLVGAFGTRSMNGKAIIYPYWENVARGLEDIIAVMTAAMLVFLLYPVILLLIALRGWWKHKGWTLKDVQLKLQNNWELYQEKMREKRKLKKKKHKNSKKVKHEEEDL